MEGLLQRVGTTSDPKKKDSFGTSYLGFSAKRVLCALGHIFNKIKMRIAQKPDTVGQQNWPGR